MAPAAHQATLMGRGRAGLHAAQRLYMADPQLSQVAHLQLCWKALPRRSLGVTSVQAGAVTPRPEAVGGASAKACQAESPCGLQPPAASPPPPAARRRGCRHPRAHAGLLQPRLPQLQGAPAESLPAPARLQRGTGAPPTSPQQDSPTQSLQHGSGLAAAAAAGARLPPQPAPAHLSPECLPQPQTGVSGACVPGA